MDAQPSFGPLAGLKVVELGQLIAGPFAAKTLADFGADVVKIEPPATATSPGGDPLRQWRLLHDGTSVWWQVQARNKKSVALDLKDPAARDLVRKLIAEADVLIENFKPGVMEDWGLGYDALATTNPGLVMLRISGYGQTGPYKDRPGFGVVAEAMGGLRHLTGEPGRVPVRVGVSIGDTLASLHGVIGILMALQHRHASVAPDAPKGRGPVIDVALNEAVFNCMESMLPEYSAFGAVREAAGSALPGIAPTNAYACSDGWVLVAGNGDSIFKRLMALIGRDDLGREPQLARNAGRVQRVVEIDAAIGAWTASRKVGEVLEALHAAAVPAGRIFTAKDIAEDPHYRARGMIQRITTADGLELDVPGIVPKLTLTPGAIVRRAPTLGEHNDAVLGNM
jgi:formyl-CoA transferase